MLGKIKDKYRNTFFAKKIVLARDYTKARFLYGGDLRSFIGNYGKNSGEKYIVLLHCHVLEKGMSHEKMRRFGHKHVSIILSNINKIGDGAFEYQYAIDTLNNYRLVYENNGWTDDGDYNAVTKFLSSINRIEKAKTSILKIKYSDIKDDFSIDYSSFLKSRHSVRDYLKKTISDSDVQYATACAIMSPSACNRQMCKIYRVEDADKRQLLIEKIQGLSGFNLPSVTLFVVTFDQRSLVGPHERNQGFFNSGLFAMNFVNALHSKGIGSCLLQCGNSNHEEEQIKEYIGIAKNERIAVFLAAGYYKDDIKALRSKRKTVNEVLAKI